MRTRGGLTLAELMLALGLVIAQDVANPTAFTYDVTATQLENGPLGSTWWLAVTVRWWSQTDESRAGSGQLFVKRARMVYVPR